MRTTVTFTSDVAALIGQRRRETGDGVSDVVNDLIRRGAVPDQASDVPPTLPTFDLGLSVDVRSVGDVLAMLDEPRD